jgi:ATP synthase F1 epsilon subunit|tara:strand:+ start:2014 stop:2409 length:396 start_codon:yes stop_codon:yes gene_type:complete
MEEKFKLEIISPEKIIYSQDTRMVTLPSYEGDMSILKNHISIITFLRPGIIKTQNKEGNFEEFFVQDGTVEYFNDNLVVLSASAINIKDLSKEFLENLNKDTKNKLAEKNIEDHYRYILNHKLDVIKDIRI